MKLILALCAVILLTGCNTLTTSSDPNLYLRGMQMTNMVFNRPLQYPPSAFSGYRW